MLKLLVDWHCPDCETIFGEYVGAFISSFGTGKKLGRPITGLSGRVLRGSSREDFLTLTDNPERRVVFFLDSLALTDLVGLDGRELLRRVGYEEDFITSLLARGTKFKLLVLPETAVTLATWNNLLDVIAGAYPDWRDKIERARSALQSSIYEQVMSNGEGIAEVRSFLEKTINVNRLFAGDGYTRSEEDPSQPVYAEYLALNKALNDFEAFAMISFQVE